MDCSEKIREVTRQDIGFCAEEVIEEQIKGMQKRLAEPDLFDVAKESGGAVREDVARQRKLEERNLREAIVWGEENLPINAETTFVKAAASEDEDRANFTKVAEEDREIAKYRKPLPRPTPEDTASMQQILNNWMAYDKQDKEEKVAKQKKAETTAILVAYLRADSPIGNLNNRFDSFKNSYESVIPDSVKLVCFPIIHGEERLELIPVK
jgi:hypothetical protein